MYNVRMLNKTECWLYFSSTFVTVFVEPQTKT